MIIERTKIKKLNWWILVLECACTLALAATAPTPEQQAAIEKIKKQIALYPDHGSRMFALAEAYGRAGQEREAVKWLNRALDTGIDLDLSASNAFPSFQDSKGFQKVFQRAAAGAVPITNAVVAFHPAEKDIIPEGIIFDPGDKHFYIGSIKKRKIIRIDLDGTTSDFTVPAQDCLWGVCGMKVDTGRRFLWANSFSDPDAGPGEGCPGLFKYDLQTGRLVKRYVLKRDPEKHLFNDVTLTPEGDAYATDSLGGNIYRVSHQTDELELSLGDPGPFKYPNGILTSPDGKRLYVADYLHGISIIDLATKKIRTVRHPRNICTFGIDGLYWYENTLIGIQNSSGMERIVKFDLNTAGDKILRQHILDRGNPLYKTPMTGVIVDHTLYFVAYGQPAPSEKNATPQPDQPQETVILRLPLKQN